MSVETQIQSLANAVAGLNAAVANVKTSADKTAEAVPAEASATNKLVDRAYLAANVKAGAEFKVVAALPTENIDEHVVYLLPVESDEGAEKNYYQEFLYVNGEWELLGEPITIDLSGMVKSVNGVAPDQNGNVQVQAAFKYCENYGSFASAGEYPDITLSTPVATAEVDGMGGPVMVSIRNVKEACDTFGKCTLILTASAPPQDVGTLDLFVYTDLAPNQIFLSLRPTTVDPNSGGVLDVWEITFCSRDNRGSNGSVACRVVASDKSSPGRFVRINANNPSYNGW